MGLYAFYCHFLLFADIVFFFDVSFKLSSVHVKKPSENGFLDLLVIFLLEELILDLGLNPTPYATGKVQVKLEEIRATMPVEFTDADYALSMPRKE